MARAAGSSWSTSFLWAAGRLKGNRHIAFASKTVPTGNLLLSVLDLFGIDEPVFGDSTGRIDGLLA